MSSKSACLLTLLASSLLVNLVPPLLAQDAANPAKKDSNAKALPPALMYVDKDRESRTHKWASLSTAQLKGKLVYHMKFEPMVEGSTAAFLVTISAKLKKKGDLVFSMPAWRPGSYRIANYGKAVTDLEAKAGGREVQVEKLEKPNRQGRTRHYSRGSAACRPPPTPAVSIPSFFRLTLVNGNGGGCQTVHKSHEGHRACPDGL